MSFTNTLTMEMLVIMRPTLGRAPEPVGFSSVADPSLGRAPT